MTTMHALEQIKAAFEAEFPTIKFDVLPPVAGSDYPVVLTNSHPSGIPLTVTIVDRPLDVAIADFSGAWAEGPPAEGTRI